MVVYHTLFFLPSCCLRRVCICTAHVQAYSLRARGERVNGPSLPRFAVHPERSAAKTRYHASYAARFVCRLLLRYIGNNAFGSLPRGFLEGSATCVPSSYYSVQVVPYFSATAHTGGGAGPAPYFSIWSTSKSAIDAQAVIVKIKNRIQNQVYLQYMASTKQPSAYSRSIFLS